MKGGLRRILKASISLRMARRPSVRRALRFLLFLAGGGVAIFVLLWVLFPYPASHLDAYPAGERVVDRHGALLRVFPSRQGEYRLPVPLREMSPWLLKATVAVEDRRFYSHPGVDPVAIVRAAWQNVARGRIHSGASTLSQQLVRMLEPRPRTLRTKAIEAFCALQLETQRTKDQLLEAYLNLAPYGGNLRGVEAASLRYFGKSARDLSLSEASLLAGLPQSPSTLRPDRHYERALKRRRVVLDAMAHEGLIDAARLEETLAHRPPVRAHAWPFRAPHLAELARARRPFGGGPRELPTVTTLDPEIQVLAERRLGEFFLADPRARRNLSGGLVVLEVETGAVRALVGSPDYFSLERRGALNATIQRRSPGSALKPFLYALAFSAGVVGPDGLLVDTPLQVAAYVPENYDRRFHGPVTAREALSLSLNVPAVRLQWKLGTETVLNALHRLGLKTLDRPARDYGLALALGAGEVRLLDLAAAYATLVRLGRHLPWRVLGDAGLHEPAPDREARQLLSPGACRLVLECLSGDAHLVRAIPDRTVGDDTFLGYKTGTSFGLRDAWAVAFTRHHVIGVWVGDPRGRSTPGLVGASAALPVAASIAAELARDRPGRVPGDGRLDELLRSWPICATSGYPAGKACPRTLAGKFPRGSPLPEVCSLHRKIRVEPLSGREVCAACTRGRATRKQVVEVWPNEVESWLSRHGVHRGGGLPAHDPDCPVATAIGRPTILSPTDGSEFLISQSSSAGRTLFLAAAASGEVTRLHWFVDGELLARADPLDEVPWKLQRGSHEIRCIDERGRAAVVRIRVR